MSTSPAPKPDSPFAARASTRPPTPAASAPVPAPAVQAEAPASRSGGGKTGVIGASAALLLLGAGGAWWFAKEAGEERRPSALAEPPAASAPASSAVAASAAAEPVETREARVARYARDFESLQTLAAGLEPPAAARAALAEATLQASAAQARVASGDLQGAEEAWTRALAAAGPVVFAEAKTALEAAASGLKDIPLADHPAPAAQSLAQALAAAEAAARDGDWALATRRADDARALAAPAGRAVAAQLAEVANAAAGRGDTAMATLFHERALRLDPELSASRAHLYRHKFKAGQIIVTPGGLELAYAPPAEFVRGSAGDEPGRDADETPQRVELTKGFFIAVNETTQRGWDRVFGAGSAARTLRAAKARPESINPDLPMHSVTWEQAAEYCRRLSEAERMSFRLPTEAEWEYACRAGTTTAFNTGAEGISARDANIDDGSAGAALAPRPPGSSGRTNAWGLRDMHGNVWEWCADWSAPYPPGTSTLRDPAGPARESLGRIDLAMKIVRGGGWNAPANDARSANRWEYAPAVATGYIGLRVAHDPDLTKP